MANICVPDNQNDNGETNMSPKGIAGVALLIGGIILLYFGYNATESVTEEVTEAVTGRYSDETMYYLIGGAIAGIVGILMLVRK